MNVWVMVGLAAGLGLAIILAGWVEKVQQKREKIKKEAIQEFWAEMAQRIQERKGPLNNGPKKTIGGGG